MKGKFATLPRVTGPGPFLVVRPPWPRLSASQSRWADRRRTHERERLATALPYRSVHGRHPFEEVPPV